MGSLGLPKKWSTVVSCLVVVSALVTPRIVFAAGVVSNNTDADLRAALVGGGTVTFAIDGTIVLTNTLVITNNTVLDGSGRLVTLSGGGAVRVLYVHPNASLTLKHLTIANGYLEAQHGAGLFNEGNCTVVDCTFSNNVLFTPSGMIPGFGGAISHMGGTLKVNGSTFVNNRCDSTGSAIGVNPSSFGSANGFAITNCTFYGNSNGYATGSTLNGGTPISTPYWIVNCTLASNINGGISFGSFNSGDNKATVVNTIVAYPIGGGNFVGGSLSKLVDGGHNISSDASAALTNSTSLINTDPLLGPLADNGGPTWTAALLPGSPAINAGDDASAPTIDQRGVPRPFSAKSDIGAFEGGGNSSSVRFSSTHFFALESQGNADVKVERTGTSAGSISVGFSATSGIATAGTDFVPTNITVTFASGEMQKSVPVFILDDFDPEGNETVLLSLHDPVGTSLDTPTTATLTIFDDEQGGAISTCDDASLRAAITNGGLVRFGCDGTIVLTNTLTITEDTILDANGHEVTLDGSGAVRVFTVTAGVSLTLSKLTIANGRHVGTIGNPGETGGAGQGGGIWMAGNLNAFDCKFRTNIALGGTGGTAGPNFPNLPGAGGSGQGGAIYNSGGQIVLSNCSFSGNRALGGNAGLAQNINYGGNSAGGAIYNTNGQVQLFNCEVSGNSSISGRGQASGAIRESGLAYGGAIHMDGGELRVTESLFSGNFSQTEYGQRNAFGGAIAQTAGSFTLRNSLLQSNSVAGGGGLIYGTPFGQPGGSAFGGCFYLGGGTAIMTNSALLSNTAIGGYQRAGNYPGAGAGGALYSTASIVMVNCTVAGNTANAGDNWITGIQGGAYGGGLYNNAGTITLVNATIANNAAIPSGTNGLSAVALGGGSV